MKGASWRKGGGGGVRGARNPEIVVEWTGCKAGESREAGNRKCRIKDVDTVDFDLYQQGVSQEAEEGTHKQEL